MLQMWRLDHNELQTATSTLCSNRHYCNSREHFRSFGFMNEKFPLQIAIILESQLIMEGD